MKKLRILKHNFQPKGEFVRIVPLGCIHVGHRNFNEKQVQGYLDYILNTPDTYTLLMGDTVENVLSETATRQAGSIHDQVMSVEEQRKYAVQLLKPLADANKILCGMEANHSIRSWNEAGFSVEEYICDQLGVPFTKVDALLEITVGTKVYRIHATHGTGGGTSLPSVFGKLLAQANRIEAADVYLRSHHHQKLLADIFVFDARSGKLQKKMLGATGCFMDYLGSYAHRKEYKPVVLGTIKIKLYKNRKDIHGTL